LDSSNPVLLREKTGGRKGREKGKGGKEKKEKGRAGKKKRG